MADAATAVSGNNPVAIVGIGCRFAGNADTPEALWEILREGRDCTREIPSDRFDASYYVSPGEKRPGKMYNARGGYLSKDLYQFDRQFFKMSPDEANHMDPVIRLILEVTWEALEDAGISSTKTRGSRTGVFIGASSYQEHANVMGKPDYNIGPYTISGNSAAMISNRISYEFDFQGPSLTLDSACSSSMYTTFLACEALKAGHCTMAISGGVNLMLLPFSNTGLCQAGMVSPDGRSKSFDESADGYGRGEGSGVLVLKLLSAALRDGDRIYAVLRGGALSNDGRTPGVSTPSKLAQIKLVAESCRNARTRPIDIAYCETHGTGTVVGDQTEIGALGESLGKCRTGTLPLYIGSIKSNIGHTEAVAGIAGLIKTALCLKHRLIPSVVHFTGIKKSLDFDKLNLHVPTQLSTWPKGQPLIACCSSFGFGGANANMILEAHENSPKHTGPEDRATDRIELGILANISVTRPHILLVSAASKEALLQRLRDWEAYLPKFLGASSQLFTSALYSASERSTHHPYRIGFVVKSPQDAIDQIHLKLANGSSTGNTTSAEGTTSATQSNRDIVFVFNGMGTQWWGMARQLMETEPVFRATIQIIGRHFVKYGAKWSLVNMLTVERNKDTINATDIAQPCICAVQIGLTELWKSREVVPSAVVGHSVGEVAAAYCSGLITLEQATRLIYNRGRQLRKTSGSGTMLAILHPVDDVKESIRISRFSKSLDIAAINSPNQLVLSGDVESIDNIAGELKTSGIKCVKLKVSNAFHSRHQEPLQKSFKQKVSPFLKGKPFSAQKNDLPIKKMLPMMSTVTGSYLSIEEAQSAEYWWQNVRKYVRFRSGIENLLSDGYEVFLEIGAHPALTPAITDILASMNESDVNAVVTGSLCRPRNTDNLGNDQVDLLLSHVNLHVSGVPVSFQNYFDKGCREVVSIPKYAWQRLQCSGITKEARLEYQFPVQDHPLLGQFQVNFDGTDSLIKRWRSNFTKSSAPWVTDHIVGGSVIMPGAAYIDIALAAAREMCPHQERVSLRNIDFQKFMYAPDGAGILETTADEVTPSCTKLTVRSRGIEGDRFTQHAEMIIDKPIESSSDVLDVSAIRKNCTIEIPRDEARESVASVGFTLGASFQVITAAFVDPMRTTALTYSQAPDCIWRESPLYVFHPAFLDGCFQTLAVLMVSKLKMEADQAGIIVRGTQRVPSSIQQLILRGKVPQCLVTRTVYREEGLAGICDITIADAETCQIICTLDNLQIQSYTQAVEDLLGPHIWTSDWVKVAKEESASEPRTCLILADDQGVGQQVSDLLTASGISTTIEKSCNSQDGVMDSLFLNKNPTITDVLVLIPLDIPLLNSLERPITLEIFRTIQQKYGFFCVSVVQAIMKLPVAKWPRLLFFTRGSHKVTPGDIVNPFSSSIHSIVLTCMYEEPRMSVVSIDLPHEIDLAATSRLVYNSVLRSPSDENILSYRSNEKDGNRDDEDIGDVYALRTDFISSAVARERTNEKAWWEVTFDKPSGVARFGLLKAVDQPIASLIAASVEVNTFSTHVLQDDLERDECTVHLLGGTTDWTFPDENESKAESTTSPGAKTTKVIGVTHDRLLSTMVISPCNLAIIPNSLSCSEAVDLVTNVLPAFVFFHDKIKLSASHHVMYLANKEMTSVDRSFICMARKIGARVFIVRDNIPGEKYGTGKLDDLSNIQDGISDLLVVSTSCVTDHRSVTLSLPKLKSTGMVAYLLADHNQSYCNVRMSPTMATYTSFATSLTSVLKRQTSLQFAKAVREIMVLFRYTNSEAGDIGEAKSSVIPMSNLPLKDGVVPDGITISIPPDGINIPLSLQTNTWVAGDDMSYLVTGGTSGFGLRFVQWLVERGARSVYVISRRPPGANAKAIYESTPYAKITHLQADLSDESRMKEVIESIVNSKNRPPLGGIFHFAAVYNDEFIFKLNQQSWNTVMNTKAYGALVLHELTQRLGIHLRYFVVISSIVSLIGNVGQASYCAANNFLNSLCAMREQMNLPCTSAAIGFINSVGYAAEHNFVKAGEEVGVMSLGPDEILGVLGFALERQVAQIGIGGAIDKPKFLQSNRIFTNQHFKQRSGIYSVFKTFLSDRDVDLVKETDHSIRQLIRDSPFSEAFNKVRDVISSILSEQLGIALDIPLEVSLISLGMNSLMSATVSQKIQYYLKASINPIDLINDLTTMKSLCTKIVIQAKESNDQSDLPPTTGNDSSETMTNPADDQWIRECHFTGVLRGYVVCFPPIANGTSFFQAWLTRFQDIGFKMLLVQLPGWEGREGEKPLQSLSDIVSKVTACLLPVLKNTRCMLFGQSIGCVVAFEVAHALMEHKISPLHMFISSWYAPSLPYPDLQELQSFRNRAFRNLTTALETANSRSTAGQIVRKHGLRLGFLDESTLNNRVMLLKLLPVIRTVFKIIRAYDCDHEDPLQCHMTVFGGKSDPFVTPRSLERWKYEISKDYVFKKVILKGSRLCLLANTEVLLQEARMVEKQDN